MNESGQITQPRGAGVITAGGRHVHAEVAGDGHTIVVLSHGAGQTRHSWSATVPRLVERGLQVLTYDHRGHGDSDWDPAGNYSTPAFTDDAIDLLETLPRPVIWVGASLGGLAGLAAVDRRPDLFHGLVMVDITFRPAMAGAERILDFMRADSEHGFASVQDAADAVARYRGASARAGSGLERNLRQGADGRWRWHWDPAFLSSRGTDAEDLERWNELESAAKRLQVPTLLISGRQSDIVTGAQITDFLATVPHADHVDIAGASHMVVGDKNDVFADAILDFVEQLERRQESEPG